MDTDSRRDLARFAQSAILDSTAEAIFGLIAGGGCTFMNRAAEQLFGYTLEECRSRDLHVLIHSKRPDGSPYPADECPIYQARRNGQERVLIEETFWSKAGQPIRALCSCAPIIDETALLGSVVTIVDLSYSHAAAEAAARLGDERLRVALANSPVTVYSQDRDLRYTWIQNPVPNAPPEQFLGKTDEDIVGPAEAARLTALKRHVLETGKGQRLELSTTSDTGPRYHDLTLEPLHDTTGAIVGVIGASIDITERKRQEAERERLLRAEQQARRQAEAAMHLRTQVLAALSHDLRTPLTTIRASAQLLQRRITRIGDEAVALLGPALGQLTQIEAATTRMIGMMEELLDVAWLQTGEPLSLRREPADLRALVDACVREHGTAAEGREIRVEQVAEPPLGDWDPVRLARALDNLLSNAVKYSPDGGPITVRLGRQEHESGPWATIEVEDRGMGIPAADLPQIFERWHRGSNVGAIAGTGVGLAGVKQIVEQHGGTVSVVSTEGQGTTFTIALPPE